MSFLYLPFCSQTLSLVFLFPVVWVLLSAPWTRIYFQLDFKQNVIKQHDTLYIKLSSYLHFTYNGQLLFMYLCFQLANLIIKEPIFCWYPPTTEKDWRIKSLSELKCKIFLMLIGAKMEQYSCTSKFQPENTFILF